MQDKMHNMLQETGENDFGQHFACNREKGDATTVAIFCSVSFLLEYNDNVGIFPLLWEKLGVPINKDKIVQPLMLGKPTIIDDHRKNVERTGCFVVIETPKDGGSTSFR